jgi:hypothetical protein
MSRLFGIIVLFLVINSCKQSVNYQGEYDVKADIRFGSKFYSIYLSPKGIGYVIKGRGSRYSKPLEIASSDTSQIFKLDSIGLSYKALDKLRIKPTIDSSFQDSPRAEIYYNNKKIYDTYRWDTEFWNVFRPIMEQIPRGFNPFRTSENPF